MGRTITHKGTDAEVKELNRLLIMARLDISRYCGLYNRADSDRRRYQHNAAMWQERYEALRKQQREGTNHMPSDDVLCTRIQLQQQEIEQMKAEHQQEVSDLKERLQTAIEINAKLRQQIAQPQDQGDTFAAYDNYRPTRAECEALYKQLRVWLECEQELEPINL